MDNGYNNDSFKFKTIKNPLVEGELDIHSDSSSTNGSTGAATVSAENRRNIMTNQSINKIAEYHSSVQGLKDEAQEQINALKSDISALATEIAGLRKTANQLAVINAGFQRDANHNTGRTNPAPQGPQTVDGVAVSASNVKELIAQAEGAIASKKAAQSALTVELVATMKAKDSLSLAQYAPGASISSTAAGITLADRGIASSTIDMIGDIANYQYQNAKQFSETTAGKQIVFGLKIVAALGLVAAMMFGGAPIVVLAVVATAGLLYYGAKKGSKVEGVDHSHDPDAVAAQNEELEKGGFTKAPTLSEKASGAASSAKSAAGSAWDSILNAFKATPESEDVGSDVELESLISDNEDAQTEASYGLRGLFGNDDDSSVASSENGSAMRMLFGNNDE